MPKEKREKEVKSKYWCFECQGRAEFRSKFLDIIPRLKSQIRLKKYQNGLTGGAIQRLELGRCFSYYNKIMNAHWKNEGDSYTCGYIEYKKGTTLTNLLKKVHGGDDFKFRISEETKVVPEGYFSQRRE
jgi:hypothetical protein